MHHCTCTPATLHTSHTVRERTLCLQDTSPTGHFAYETFRQGTLRLLDSSLTIWTFHLQVEDFIRLVKFTLFKEIFNSQVTNSQTKNSSKMATMTAPIVFVVSFAGVVVCIKYTL